MNDAAMEHIEENEKQGSAYQRALPTILCKINAGKQQKINATTTAMLKAVPFFYHKTIRLWQENGSIAAHPSITGWEYNNGTHDNITQRMGELLAGDASRSLRSWISNLKNRIKRTIKNAPTLDEATKRVSYFLIKNDYAFGPTRTASDVRSIEAEKLARRRENAKKRRQQTSNKKKKKPRAIKDPLDGIDDVTLQHALDVTRSVARHWRKKWHYPTPSKNFITLDNHLCRIDKSPTTKTYAYVACISVLGGKRAGKGDKQNKRTPIPFNLPEYAEQQLKDGLLIGNAIQLGHDGNGNIVMKAVATGHTPTENTFDGDWVAIDEGCVVPMATSDGDLLLSTKFWEQIKKYDNQYQRAQKGGTGACKRCKEIIKRMRGYMKSEIRRSLKKYLLRRRPARVGVEAFTSEAFQPDRYSLSPRMRRLVRSVGHGVFREALVQYSEVYGFELVEYDPAYTSKGCECGYEDDANRPDRNTFICRNCEGSAVHADVHAARRGLDRCSVPGAWRFYGSGDALPSCGDTRERMAARLVNHEFEKFCCSRGADQSDAAVQSAFIDWFGSRFRVDGEHVRIRLRAVNGKKRKFKASAADDGILSLAKLNGMPKWLSALAKSETDRMKSANQDVQTNTKQC